MNRITSSRNHNYDIKEYQKNEIYKQGGTPDIYHLRIPPPSSETAKTANQTPEPKQTVGFKDWNIYFDTAHATVPSDLASGEVVFNISDINNNVTFGNVIEMQLGSFYFQIPPQDPTLPNFFYYRRVYLTITGLPSTQSARTTTGTYHFEFDVSNLTSIAVLLTPVNTRFFLQTPLVSINEIRMLFRVGPNLTPIPLQPTTIAVTSVAGSNPARFTITGATTEAIGPIGVLAVPVAIYVTGLTIFPPINTVQGVFATTVIDLVTFEVGAYSFAAVGAQLASAVVAKNRIAFPIRFTSVENKATNYAIVTQT